MKSKRTYQQELVASRLTLAIKMIEAANEKLETKANTMLAASTSVVAVVAGVNLFPSSIVKASNTETVFVVLLCISSLVMFWFAAKVLGPRPSSVGITPDLELMYKDYIAKSEDVAYNNALIDDAHVLDHITWVNKEKGKQIRHMFLVLQAQIVILGLGATCKVFCGA